MVTHEGIIWPSPNGLKLDMKDIEKCVRAKKMLLGNIGKFQLFRHQVFINYNNIIINSNDSYNYWRNSEGKSLFSETNHLKHDIHAPICLPYFQRDV